MSFLTGSLVDYLKTTEGSSLPMNTLIDMAAQARHLFLASTSTLLSLHLPGSLSFILSLPVLSARSSSTGTWPLS